MWVVFYFGLPIIYFRTSNSSKFEEFASVFFSKISDENIFLLKLCNKSPVGTKYYRQGRKPLIICHIDNKHCRCDRAEIWSYKVRKVCKVGVIG